MSQPQLARRLGTGDAVVVGLASMIGAGVFAAFAPAAAAAGPWLLAGLAIAAVVAFCNATSSAQLAAQHPESGGTYVYGREHLGPWAGFVAGWGFVIGKTASCAAMALTFAAYVLPEPAHGWLRPVAVVAVVALTAVNLRGVTRTARLGRVLVAITLTALAIAVAAIAVGEATRAPDAPLDPGAAAAANTVNATDAVAGGPWAWHGVLQAAGLLFFAFAGYARVATLGEEVRDPARTIPRAIVVALGVTVAVYAAVAVAVLAALGPARLAASTAPVADAVRAAGHTWAVPVVAAGAAVATLGALLALVAGVGRTTLAMARRHDLPHVLAAVHPRLAVPQRAELAVAAAVCALVLTVDVRGAIGFSSFGVLTYYLVANAAAWTQRGPHRRWPRPLQVVGAAGCVVLAVTLPWQSVAAGAAVLAAGVAGRAVRLRLARRRAAGGA